MDTIVPISEWPVSNATEEEQCKKTSKQKHNDNDFVDCEEKYFGNGGSGINKTHLEATTNCSNSRKTKMSKLSVPYVEERTHNNSQIMTLKLKQSREECRVDGFVQESDVTSKIARWWRQRKSVEEVPKCSPKSMLFHISRLPECRKFLAKERKRLVSLSALPGNKADVYAAIASSDDCTGEFLSALNYITQAVQLAPACDDYIWLMEKISRQCQIHKQQTEGLMKIKDKSCVFPCAVKVPRICAKDLSVEDFQENYLKARKPLIITDVVAGMTSEPFDYDLVKKHAGKTVITTKEAGPNSFTWAKLEDKRDVTVSELIKGICDGTADDFLFDWSLPLHCPDLAAKISLPEYFKDNYLLQTSPGSLYKDSWPSLFIAPKGATTEIHVDAFHSHFWMALFDGQKRWTFFDHEDVPFLYPRLFQSMDPVFEVDLREPDLEKFSLLSLTQPQQCVLQQGELLFVPAGSPHYVENLTSTLAISSNYVDHTNYEKVCEELRTNALQDERAKDLLRQLQEHHFLDKFENDNNINNSI